MTTEKKPIVSVITVCYNAEKYIEGVLQVILDKNNYDILMEANYEFTQNYKVQGLEVKDLYKFISKEDNGKYLVEI